MALYNGEDLLANHTEFNEQQFLIENPFAEIIPKQPDDFETIKNV